MMRMTVAFLVLVMATGGCGFGHVDAFEFNSTSMASLEGGGTQFGSSIDGVMWSWNVTFGDVKETPEWMAADQAVLSRR